MDPTSEDQLAARATDALRAAAGQRWLRAELEWSQAGAQHSGRAIVVEAEDAPARWIVVPDDAVTALAALRGAMARPGTGTWLSVLLRVSADGTARIDYNYDARPYWNSTGRTMLEAPERPPVPAEDRWLADLRRHPRDRAHVPAWLAPEAIDGEAVAELRAALDRAGIPRGGTVLPGEDGGTPLEGTVEVIRHGPGHFELRVSDYGQHEFLAEFRTEREACGALWQYVAAPMPPPVPMAPAELEARARAAAHSYVDLYRRLEAAGPGGMITNLAPGVPYDRIGTVDGLFFFGWGTPWEQRSLPDSARGPGSARVTLVARHPIEIQAEIVPPWFGHPGGGVRFRVEERHRGVRDLVRAGSLVQVQPVG